MEGLGKCFEGGGVSELAVTLITNSKRYGSTSNNQSACSEWTSWCYERDDPFKSNIIEILYYFFLKKSMSLINFHMSAKYASHKHQSINDISCRTH